MLISNLFRRVRESFQSRVFFLLTFLILVTSVAFTALYLRNESISQSERLVAEGELLARLLAYNSRLAVFAEQESMLREVADGILQHDNVLSAAVIGADGKILTLRVKTGNMLAAAGADGPILLAGLPEGTNKTIHFDKADHLEFFAPVIGGSGYSSPESLYFNGSPSVRQGRNIGLVRVILDKKDLNARLHKLLVTSLLLAMLFLLFGLAVAYLVVKSVTKPLNSLLEGVKTLEQGDLSGRIAVATEDELGKVSLSFNYMAEALERREAENRELEEQLRLAQQQEAKEEWERTFDTVPDLIAILNREDRVVRVNKAMAELLRTGKDDAVGRKLYEFFHGADATTVFPRLSDLHDAYGIFFTEVCQEKLQRFFLVTVSPLLKNDGSMIGSVFVARDITERKQAEEALRSSAEEFRALFETSRDAIMILDRHGFLDCNKATLDMFGCESKAQFFAKQLEELSPPQQQDGKDSSPAIRERLETAYVEGYQFFEWLHRRMDGTLFPAEVLFNRFELHGKTVLQAVLRDVTERKKMKEQLWQSQKMEAIGQLAGGIAHDFNNILTAIIGFANLVEMRMDKQDPSMQYLEQVLAAADRATHLTQGLLAFSRRQVINPQPIDINSIITNVEKLLKRLISEEIELTISLAGGDLVVMADSGQIDQVLMNLATNARDAMPDGGELTLETSLFEMTDDYIRTYGFGTRGHYAMLAIRDTGDGMVEATRARIFEPFFTTKEVGKGTGLGMAIVYGIVKQHNGFINVYSEHGKGTAFKIYLPLAQEEKAQIHSPEELQAVIGGMETLLVVEDNPEVRKLNKALLETYGYRVIEAVDGQDAVVKFVEHPDDIKLVVMDVVMPKMNGKEAFAEMSGIRPGMKVLFTSAYTPDVVQKKGVLMEGFNFITKPSSPQALLRKIKELLDG